MNDEAVPAETLSRELEASFRNRADLYRLFSPNSPANTVRKRPRRSWSGRSRSAAGRSPLAFSGFGPNEAREIGEAFLAVSPDGGRMYPTEVERSDGISFQVKRCPLKDAWREAGVGDEKLETLCRIAGAFDRGLFEATGVRFQRHLDARTRLRLLPYQAFRSRHLIPPQLRAVVPRSHGTFARFTRCCEGSQVREFFPQRKRPEREVRRR